MSMREEESIELKCCTAGEGVVESESMKAQGSIAERQNNKSEYIMPKKDI